MVTSLTLYPLGVGDAFTTRHFFVNCLVNVDGREFFIDCPAYVPKMLRHNGEHGELSVELQQYKELFITHMHADHVGGLEELAYLQEYRTLDPPKLYGPHWLLQDIWSHLRPAMEHSVRGDGRLATLDWFFEPVVLENPHDFGQFIVSYRLAAHVPPTLALKFDFGNYVLGYAPDTAFDPSLLDWLADCNLIVHDVWFGDVAVLGGDIRNLHTPIEDLLRLPDSFQRKTLLCHYADSAFESNPATPAHEIGAYRLLEQGRLYRLV